MRRTGYLYKRGKIWWGRVTVKGERKAVSLETTHQTVARTRLAKWLERKEAEHWGEKPRRTVDEALERFAKDHFPTLKAKSATRYLVSIEHLIDHFEGAHLDEIGSAKLVAFEQARLAAGVTPATVRRDLACLSSVFSRAEEWEWHSGNPVKPFLRGRKAHGLRESPPRERYLSQDEEARVLDKAQPKAARAMMFAIDTGLRKEEQLSLLRDDVDFRRGEITG